MSTSFLLAGVTECITRAVDTSQALALSSTNAHLTVFCSLSPGGSHPPIDVYLANFALSVPKYCCYIAKQIIMGCTSRNPPTNLPSNSIPNIYSINYPVNH